MSSSFGEHLLINFFNDSKVTYLFGKEITLATTLLADIFFITASLMAKMAKNHRQCDQFPKK